MVAVVSCQAIAAPRHLHCTGKDLNGGSRVRPNDAQLESTCPQTFVKKKDGSQGEDNTPVTHLIVPPRLDFSAPFNFLNFASHSTTLLSIAATGVQLWLQPKLQHLLSQQLLHCLML